MSIDPTLQVAALAALETTVNGALALDEGTRVRLQELDGHLFYVECTSPELTLYIRTQAPGIKLLSFCADKPSAGLHGPAPAYAALLAASDKGAALINSDIRLQGDSNAIIRLTEILSGLELDWEAELANVVGDVPAHLIGQTARHLGQWGKDARDIFVRHLEEYIHEEGRLSPSRLEIEDFFDDIQLLDKDAKRLQSRIDKLRTQLTDR